METKVRSQPEGMVFETRRPPDDSPLFAIQKKEIELNAETMRVKKQAEDIIAKARKQALDIHEKAERGGAEKAREINEKAMAKAKAQAAQILKNEESQTEEIKDRGRDNMKRAIADITDAVLGRQA